MAIPFSDNSTTLPLMKLEILTLIVACLVLPLHAQTKRPEGRAARGRLGGRDFSHVKIHEPLP